MAFDVATARLKVGLTAIDATQDVQLEAALNVALAIVENYCDRPFLYKSQVEVFQHVSQGQVQVQRYPIDAIVKMDGATPQHQVNHVAGIIDFHGQHIIERLEVTYSGGYKVLPADLEMCLWTVFSSVWPQFDPSVTTGGGGGATVIAGQIKKQSIVGVGSVEFTSSADAVTGSSGGSTHNDLSAVMPGATEAILQPYVRKSA